MAVAVSQEPPTSLAEYARIPIAFEVRRAVEVRPSSVAPSGYVLAERAIDPYEKDYDAEGDGGPLAWPARFDVSRWAFFVARDMGRPVGAAACVFDSPDITMLHGQEDVALLWDIRVTPDARGRGIGSALLAEVEHWSVERAAQWLEVETQTINVPACRFYARHGFELRAVNRGAYPDLPHETQLLWYKRLDHSPTARRSSRSV